MSIQFCKKLMAEAFGTFWIVFAGTGAIVVNETTGVVYPFGVSITFCLIVFIMILFFGEISGAHFNPAVSLGFYFSKRNPIQIVMGYTNALWLYITPSLIDVYIAVLGCRCSHPCSCRAAAGQAAQR